MRIQKRIRECITTLNKLKQTFEKEATPRMPLRLLRSDIDLSIAMIEKQLQKDVLKRADSTGMLIKYYCPSCQRYLGQKGRGNVILFNKETYCQREGCGQALKWDE